jgi:membrane-associated phospholipid phosphatase
MANSILNKIMLHEKIIVGYCLLMISIILFIGSPLNVFFDEIRFYIIMAVITIAVALSLDESKGGIIRFLRLFAPGVMFLFFYRETGGLMFLLFDSFYDWQLTIFEKMVIGTNLTLFIDQHLLNVITNEILSFCYFSYYFMIPFFMIYLFYKKDYELLKNFLSAVCLTFFISYMLFFLYPIEGPRWFFAGLYQNNIEGPIFRQLVNLVIHNAAVRGGCMPSSHFGVALVILIYSRKYYPKIGKWLLPIVIGLGMGTVWGRFHYISDVFVGGFIGLVSVYIIWKYYKLAEHKSINRRTT